MDSPYFFFFVRNSGGSRSMAQKCNCTYMCLRNTALRVLIRTTNQKKKTHNLCSSGELRKLSQPSKTQIRLYTKIWQEFWFIPLDSPEAVEGTGDQPGL